MSVEQIAHLWAQFPFHREVYRRLSAQAGGPISKDRVWFFGAYEHFREHASQPGSDPQYPSTFDRDRYDLKICARIGERHEISGLVHHEEFDSVPFPGPSIEPSATYSEVMRTPAWQAGLVSTLTQNLLLELKYAGWWGDDVIDSITGSREDPFIDFTSPEGVTWSGGVWRPGDVVSGRHQAGGKATYYADKFLKSQHEFRFGVQYSRNWGYFNVGIGPNGTYSYNIDGTIFQAIQDPFQYGGFSNELVFFVDDTVTAGDRLTLNLGLRFDHNTGGIPDYDRLTVGTPSVSIAGNFKATGETIPGIPDLIRWNLFSPRLGVVYQAGDGRRSILQGSFGVYYDHNVIGNWAFPPPKLPPFRLYMADPQSGQLIELPGRTAEHISFNKDVCPPRALQFSVGYEQQLSESMVTGVQYIYKDTKDLIGWEILGGAWESVPFVDPFTGTEYTLLSQVERPILQKGNAPGDFPGSEGLRYFQEYHGVLVTFEKRFSGFWGVNASYTWSKSYGLIPTTLEQSQLEPLFLPFEGNDPNHFINGEGRLQADRPHMFRLQAVFYRLPGDIQVSTSLDFSSGRHHTRQISVGDLGQGKTLGQGPTIVIMERGLRYPAVHAIDVSAGKKFQLGKNLQIRLEGTIYNLLNSNAELMYGDPLRGLVLQDPSRDFVPTIWTKPRRLQLRIGFQF